MLEFCRQEALLIVAVEAIILADVSAGDKCTKLLVSNSHMQGRGGGKLPTHQVYLFRVPILGGGFKSALLGSVIHGSYNQRIWGWMRVKPIKPVHRNAVVLFYRLSCRQY